MVLAARILHLAEAYATLSKGSAVAHQDTEKTVLAAVVAVVVAQKKKI